jgi:prephenate dehydrogenase
MNISIVGLGMIGASLASQLKQSGNYVKAYARRIETVAYAESSNLVDQAFTNVQDAVVDVDLIIICTPIDIIPQYVKEVDKFAAKGTVVTDVGSIKSWIVNHVEKLALQNVEFIGGHPMAGSEKMGAENFKENLFKDRPYVITPQSSTTTHSKEIIKELVSILDAKYLELDCEDHDRRVCAISHLPYVISSTLLHRYEKTPEELKSVISSGFKDMTRIAYSDPKWGEAVMAYNKENIVNEIDHYIKLLTQFKESVISENKTEIASFLDHQPLA